MRNNEQSEMNQIIEVRSKATKYATSAFLAWLCALSMNVSIAELA